MKVSLPGARWNYYLYVTWSWRNPRIGVEHNKEYHYWAVDLVWLSIELEQG